MISITSRRILSHFWDNIIALFIYPISKIFQNFQFKIMIYLIRIRNKIKLLFENKFKITIIEAFTDQNIQNFK